VSFAGRLRRRLRMRLNRGRPLGAQKYLVEPNSERFDPRMMEFRVTRPVYLEGYWQHEEYFKDIREQLCQELTLRTPHDAVNVEFAERIKAVEAVCLHVRRLHGVPNKPDAAPLADSNKQHIDASYYQNAVERLAQDVRQPHFFVFSDYPDWAKEHVHTSYPIEYVTHNGADKDYEDFWLMGQCKHFIVANSTFSWWAAWLSQNAQKRVIAPKDAIGQMLKSVPRSWMLV
jgi:hypothetical protein